MTDDSEEITSRNELVGAERARITSMQEASRLTDVEFEALRIVHPLTRNKVTLSSFNALLQLLMQQREKSNFVVAVTGLDRGVGASYVALNLAATIATDLRHTALLIQCNAHPSTLNRIMTPYPNTGLLNYLGQSDMDINEIVYPPGIARMRVIPYGSGAAEARLLGSERMAQMINKARARYSDRFVVLDLPCINELGAARAIPEWADMTILVVPYGAADAGSVRPALDVIGEQHLSGLLMNRVPG